MWMDADDIAKLSGRKRVKDQAEFLAMRGIPYKMEDRRLLVLADDVRKWMHNEPLATHGGINWAAVT